MSFKIIITVGDALISNPKKLKQIDSYGDCIYRINGAHIDTDNLPTIVKALRGILGAPDIMLDLPGNKVRTEGLSEPIRLAKGETFELHDYQINYPRFYAQLKTGDLILTNDSTATLEVKEINGTAIKIMAHSDGLLSNRKSLHVRGAYRNIPFLFKKDIELIRIASLEKLAYISLSFVRTGEDVKEVKKILLDNQNDMSQIIVKVETQDAVKNLDAILKETSHINLDRGDLSSDIGMLELPDAQEYIINSSKRAGKYVYLATQFLKNMEQNPIPLIAEVMDLHKTIKSGISGIQLSEETAVGKYPVECVKLIRDIFSKLFPSQKEVR